MRIIAVLLLTLVSCFAQEEGTPISLADAKADFARADKALNAAYTATKKAISEYAFEELRKDQREWLEYRDAQALATTMFNDPEIKEGKEKQSPSYWNAMASISDLRVVILRGWRGVGDPNSLSGFYIDGYGGSLTIAEKGQKLYFKIDVVRGPTYHLGNLEGVASVNQNMARFTDKGKDGDREDETWLTFIQENRTLKVIGANTSYYHGARAYFDGDYIRVETIDAKTTADLLKLEK